MSQIVLSPNAAGSAQFTLAAPDTNTNRTLTLPDAAGTVLVDNAVPSLNGGQLAGMRNKIINGKMEIAQRGTSFPAVASDAYSIDRWAFGNTSSAVLTASQQTDVPSGNEFQSSLRFATTTADSSIAAGDVCWVNQRIEGYNVRDLIGRTFTLSFWVRSSKTGVHCVALKNSNSDRTYLAEYTVNVANTWEQKSIAITGGLITAGTWNWTNGIGLRVDFALACGTTFQAAPGSWQPGDFYATANQVNVLDTVGNIFAITGVQLEVGSVATPFEHRPYGAELVLCQRYACAFIASANTPINGQAGGLCTNTTTAAVLFRCPVSMRATPTQTSTSAAATFGVLNSAGVNTAVSAVSVVNNSVDGPLIQFTSTGLVAGNSAFVYAAAGQTASIILSAEL